MYRCSVFCSFYKGGKFIRSYLEDMGRQDMFADIEWVFVDCASPEGEHIPIRNFMEGKPNVIYTRLDKDPGLYEGWNTAIRMCTSPLVSVWNIDDKKSRDGLKLMITRMEDDPAVGVLYGITYETTTANQNYEDNNFQITFPCMDPTYENLIKCNSPHCMPMWRKHIHDSVGFFDNTLTSAADYEFWLRCLVRRIRFRKLNHPVGLYYRNPTGRSTDPSRMEVNQREVIQVRSRYVTEFMQSGIISIQFNLDSKTATFSYIDSV